MQTRGKDRSTAEQGGETDGSRPAGGTLAALLYLVSIILVVVGAWQFDAALGLVVAGVLLAVYVTMFVLEV